MSVQTLPLGIDGLLVQGYCRPSPKLTLHVLGKLDLLEPANLAVLIQCNEAVRSALLLYPYSTARLLMAPVAVVLLLPAVSFPLAIGFLPEGFSSLLGLYLSGVLDIVFRFRQRVGREQGAVEDAPRGL